MTPTQLRLMHVGTSSSCGADLTQEYVLMINDHEECCASAQAMYGMWRRYPTLYPKVIAEVMRRSGVTAKDRPVDLPQRQLVGLRKLHS